MTKTMKGLINEEEIFLARQCLETARECGASASRATLSKSVVNTIGILDGKIDRISNNLDRSIFLHIFSKGRYSTFSTNKIEKEYLVRFTKRAVEQTELMAPDKCYSLPDPKRKACGFETGDELEMADEKYLDITPDQRLELALESHNFEALSMESEYCDSLDDCVTIDSEGFFGRTKETSYSFNSSATLADGKGRKYEGYAFCGALRLGCFDKGAVSAEAIYNARRKAGERRIRSGKYRIVVDRHISSRLAGPLFSALNAFSLYHHNSFLENSLGKTVFSEDLSITDLARQKGRLGSRPFDSEGVATSDSPIISKGEVLQYFTNTYMAAKTGFAPSIESVTRPSVKAFSRLGSCKSSQNDINLEDLILQGGNAVYITGFNGGNCNSGTGDFSFGIEGFLVRGGEIAHPIREAVLTGNMNQLWNSISAAGNDALDCLGWQIPSLVFENIDINA